MVCFQVEEKDETFVYLFQEKKGLFQEQAGLLVSRTAQRIKTLFEEWFVSKKKRRQQEKKTTRRQGFVSETQRCCSRKENGSFLF